MDNRINFTQAIHPVRNINSPKNTVRANSRDSAAFKEILEKKLESSNTIKFSKHAQDRLNSRSIMLSDKELNQLAEGVKKAEEKGARDSLIMLNDIAYVVSIKNKTVITAVDNNSLEERVFTNIDSAVFMD